MVFAVRIAAEIRALVQPLARKTPTPPSPGTALPWESPDSPDSCLWPEHLHKTNPFRSFNPHSRAPNTALHVPAAAARAPSSPKFAGFCSTASNSVSRAARGRVSLCSPSRRRQRVPGSSAGSRGVLACIKPRRARSCRPHCSRLILPQPRAPAARTDPVPVPGLSPAGAAPLGAAPFLQPPPRVGHASIGKGAASVLSGADACPAAGFCSEASRRCGSTVSFNASQPMPSNHPVFQPQKEVWCLVFFSHACLQRPFPQPAHLHRGQSPRAVPCRGTRRALGCCSPLCRFHE